MSKKKELSPEQKAECEAAKAIFLSKKDSLGLTQAKLAAAADISPAAVAMYFNGTNPLNARFASVLSVQIREPVDRFSPRLAKELAEMAQATGFSSRRSDSSDHVHSDEYHLNMSSSVERLVGRAAVTEKVESSGSPYEIDIARQAIDAMALITVFAAGGKLPAKDAQSIIAIRNRLAHSAAKSEDSYTELPEELQALAKSAIGVAEAAQNAGDLASMLSHGMKKHRQQKESSNDVAATSKRKAES